MANEWYDNITSSRYNNYNNYDGAQEYDADYDENMAKSLAGSVGHFDINTLLNRRRPSHLTQDMGASTYRAPPTYPGSFNPHEGFGTADVSSTFEGPEKKGFNFLSPIKSGLGWLKEKFQRTPQKQAAYDAIMGSMDDNTGYGTYKGNQYRFGTDQSGLTKVYSEVNPWGKNFDSILGSKSLEEMDQKTLDWAIDRLNNNKKISTRLTNILRNRNMLPTQKTAIDLTTIQDPGKGSVTDTSGGAVTTGGGGVFNPRMDPKGRGQTRDSWHGATASRQAKGKQVAGPGFGQGAYWADGGRVGYRNAGPVLDVQEDENILDFMQDQGISHGEMAEGMSPFDLRVQELIDEGLSWQEAWTIASEEFGQTAEGESDQGIASLV